MRAHLTKTVKNRVKQTNSELAIIHGGLTKELQPLHTGVVVVVELPQAPEDDPQKR